MSEPTLKTSTRKLTALELSAPARGALRRLKRERGMSFTHAVEQGLRLLERSVVIGQPMLAGERAELGLDQLPEEMPAADRKSLGLSPLPPLARSLPARNRKKGGER